MGLLGDLFKNRSLKDPVRGSFQVTTSSQAPHSATSGNVRLMGVVTGEGVPPTSIEHHCIARVTKWPRAGAVLPVLVDRADPSSLKILWDEVADGWDAGRAQADALAQALQSGGTGAFVSSTAIDARGVPGLRDEVLGLLGQGGSPDDVVEALRARGIAIPPGAQVNVVASGEATGGGDEDPAARLRTLEGLRESGLVSDAEYQELRARILADL